MLFNGHTQESINNLDENTMNEIVVMYGEGLLGNNQVLTLLGTLIAGVFNYIRPQGTQPYNLKGILGNAYNYIYREPEISVNDKLLLFMTQAQGFSMDKFKRS